MQLLVEHDMALCLRTSIVMLNIAEAESSQSSAGIVYQSYQASHVASLAKSVYQYRAEGVS